MCVHLWFSLRLTDAMAMVLKDQILPLFQEMSDSLKTLPECAAGYTTCWKFGISTIRVTFTRRQWFMALLILKRAVPISRADALAQWLITLTGNDQPYRCIAINERQQLLPYPYRYLNSQWRQGGIFRPSYTHDMLVIDGSQNLGRIGVNTHFSQVNP